MTSRAAHGNDFVRLLLMPALALGLVVGCAPAKGGGAGNTGGSSGQPSGGNSGNTSASTTSPSGGNTTPPASTTSPSGGNTTPPASTTSPSGGTTTPPGSTTNPSGGNTTPPSGGSTTSSSSRAGGTTTPPSGGTTTPPSGGTTISGGSRAGGTTTSSGGTTTLGGSSSTPGGTTGSTGGSTSSGTNPAGYWTSKDWHGCAWTSSADNVAGSTTSITPNDFTAHKDGDPYCVSGTVFNDYNAVALLGFNLNQPNTDSCAFKTTDPNAVGPPAVTAMAGATGLAINFAKTTAPIFRVQIEDPTGSKTGTAGANDRWCYNIAEAAGPIFVPYTKFNTKCWEVTATSNGTGTFYDGSKMIDAVVFLVPGTVASTTPYSFCVNGFAAGNSVADAPAGGGPINMTGTIGGANNTAANYQRVKIASGGKSYIIQNNNWGNSGSGQTISYTNNTFKITATTGNGSSAPASFPSIYIGANGQIASGTFSTSENDNLPIQVSAIKSVQTSFAWSGGSGGKDFNATYDVWFASSKPAAGSYNDAVSGFVMVWLHKPSNHQPIGSIVRTASIAGQTWNVWVGPRGTAAVGTDGANRPVVSYVAQSDVSSLTFDLNLFIKDAAANGIQSGWYLTDVFAGFEIWTGSDSANLACTGFTCVVQ